MSVLKDSYKPTARSCVAKRERDKQQPVHKADLLMSNLVVKISFFEFFFFFFRSVSSCVIHRNIYTARIFFSGTKDAGTVVCASLKDIYTDYY